MIQFEKWWKKHNPKSHVESINFEMDSDIWKAALEMLSNKLEQMTEPPDCRCIHSIQEIIKEELEV